MTNGQPHLSSDQKYNVDIGEESIGQFAELPDGEDRAGSYAQDWFRLRNRLSAVPEAITAAKEAVDHARRQIERVRDRINDTPLYGVSEESDPQAQTNVIEQGTGVVGVIILLFALLTVPGIATMQIVQSGKIALVADYPAFGLVFGITALVGILAAIEWRSKIGRYEDRLSFDRALLKATIGVFVLWSLALALAAYPIQLGDVAQQAGANDWGNLAQIPDETAAFGFKIQTPMWLVFFITALLDLLAAPTLHQLALNRLARLTLKRITPDAEKDHLENVELPAATASLDEAIGNLRELLAEKEGWEAAMKICEARAIAILKSKVRLAEADSKVAAANHFYGASRQTNGASVLPNGHSI